MERWAGKLAVVTGASSGIGAAIAKALATNGLNVLGLARREDKLKELSNLNTSSKHAFHYMKCDLFDESDIIKAFEYADTHFGGVHILVNNAGTVKDGTLGAGKTEDFRKVMDLNVIAPTICIREALKSMRKHKNEAHIFNINSVFGINPTLAPMPINLYPASKFALRALTETLKSEIRQNKDKIRVTGIYPALVKTELLASNGFDEQIYNIAPYLESKDLADCLMFALSAPPHVQIDDIVVNPVRR
ncbi:farnesol dehydrogenase-like [Microplitis mediator]|uniref:farnesol dehydrogenase-like n=1 Tax=Microplitis mediator TaxID=375433 RepID=UPI0025576E71|nr:farnesol dehydrogenase-like [Microplitis mediator]